MSTREVMSVAEQFGARAAQRVDALYRTPDIIAQRDGVMQRLALRIGERVIDIGSGPGLLAHAMAGVVGPQGSVLGIDNSAAMIDIARERSRNQSWARFEEGVATALPCADSSADVVVCTQVLEYVPDVQRAIEEIVRVLRPGGRYLIMDTDWESCVWASASDDRMRRMIEVWNGHCAHPYLPRTLSHSLETAGLTVGSVDVLPIINYRFDPDTYSAGMIDVIAKFVARSGAVQANVIDAWTNDLRSAAHQKRYFFSLNRYVFCGDCPT